MQASPVEYAQNVFDSAYGDTLAARKPIHREAWLRALWAYGLKAIAVFGGLSIASGKVQESAQWIGIAIAVAVAMDGLFSNHVQMMLVTKAAQAYKRIATQARRAHQQQLTSILQKKDPKPAEAERELIALLQKLTGQLHSGCKEIEDALDTGRLAALNAVSLDSERSKDR